MQVQLQNMNQQASPDQIFQTIAQSADLIKTNNNAAQAFYNIFHPSMQQQQQLQLQMLKDQPASNPLGSLG